MSAPNRNGGPIERAWQQTLAAEYAAVFGYGVLGPRLVDATQITLARSSQQAHRDLVAQSEQQLTAAGLAPPAAEASYPLPYPIPDDATARQLALRLEEATASAWRYLISAAAVEGSARSAASSTPAPASSGSGLVTLRATALAALTDAAVRAVSWRRLVSPTSPTVPFPGI